MILRGDALDKLKEFEGAYGGFQPKPAVEVIIVIQKPGTEPTQAGQALNNGKGITWLDDCRIPYSDESDQEAVRACTTEPDKHSAFTSIEGKYDSGGYKKKDENTQGRFPANLLVSDDVLDDGKITKSSPVTQSKNTGFGGNNNDYGQNSKDWGKEYQTGCYDKGTFSRFFSLDAWAEKNLPFLIVPKASKKEKNAGVGHLEGYGRFHNSSKSGEMMPSKKMPPSKVKGNHHPTVKPIKLMSYLITLGSRPGDTILDPFAGSGTTGCAAEMLGREYILIEMTEEYIPIIEARLEHWKNENQPRLF